MERAGDVEQLEAWVDDDDNRLVRREAHTRTGRESMMRGNRSLDGASLQWTNRGTVVEIATTQYTTFSPGNDEQVKQVIAIDQLHDLGSRVGV